MKNIDLRFMQRVIHAVEKSLNCENLYLNYVKKYQAKFENVQKTVCKYYANDHLLYDASVNNFLVSNN